EKGKRVFGGSAARTRLRSAAERRGARRLPVGCAVSPSKIDARPTRCRSTRSPTVVVSAAVSVAVCSATLEWRPVLGTPSGAGTAGPGGAGGEADADFRWGEPRLPVSAGTSIEAAVFASSRRVTGPPD